MIITISGALGAGKSTIAKMLKQKLGLKHYSIGDFMREIAKEKGLSLIELSKIAEKERWVDELLDQRQIKLGKEEDDFVIDSRIGWYFIPNSIKIYLDVSDEEAARRTFQDQGNRPEESIKSIDDVVEKIRRRKASEIQRYQEYYGVNHHDKKHYDLVIDTTTTPPDKVINKIVSYIKEHNLNKAA